MNSPALQLYPSADLMARMVAAEIADLLADAVELEGTALFVGAGGTTPRAIYGYLSAAPICWKRINVTLTDERWAPLNSLDSNARMLGETLLQGAAASAIFSPLPTVAPNAIGGADEAEDVLRNLHRSADIMLLGMGEDGHIASLFPGSSALAEGLDPEGRRLCIAVPAGEPAPPQARISLTLNAIAKARRVVLAITGESKRRTIQRALSGDDLPVRAVIDHTANLSMVWAP